MIGIVLTIVLCGAALWCQGRESPAGAVFFACAVIVFPLGLAIVRGSNVVYPRYFFLSIEFLLLLLSFWLGALWQSRSPARRAAVLAMLLTFCIVNGLHAAALLRHGRATSPPPCNSWPIARRATSSRWAPTTTFVFHSPPGISRARRFPARRSTSRPSARGRRMGPSGTSFTPSPSSRRRLIRICSSSEPNIPTSWPPRFQRRHCRVSTGSSIIASSQSARTLVAQPPGRKPS